MWEGQTNVEAATKEGDTEEYHSDTDKQSMILRVLLAILWRWRNIVEKEEK